MGPHVTFKNLTSITLAVRDLPTAQHFYVNGLGFVADDFEGVNHPIGAARFFWFSGMRLGLWPISSMCLDTGASLSLVRSGAVYGLSVSSQKEVSMVVQTAVQMGGTLLVEPRENFWGGFSGYITDPDDHIWEVIFDPGVLRSPTES
jgi:catechol 2,3-dioxygenase-like lactoylglutathione lyase family enzyme